ncbi:bacteriohemerythrin [Oleispirillum naphthae]|uniref:bacteriohemerythrin n=1 Tax=Oleispirillum naphthae TaxID=2838853 RepID=UPI0030826309
MEDLSPDAPRPSAAPAADTVVISNEELLNLRSEHRRTLYLLRQTQEAYGHFVPKGFLHILGTEDILDVRLGHEIEKKITIMFSDIRNFTTLSEAMTSHQTFEFINGYLALMEPAVQTHGGIIDKFIGDAVMAFFPERAAHALEAAFAMRDALSHLNGQRRNAGQEPIAMGIGLNTGLTTLGVIGHMGRMEATIIGDAVNVASRLESLTKQYHVGILISEDTLACLDGAGKHLIRFIDRVVVKGRLRPISVYEVFDGDERATAEAKLSTLDIFEKAVAYYHLGEADLALPLFHLCREKTDLDPVADIYLKRCLTCIETGVLEGPHEFHNRLEWCSAYETGIADVDRQHHGLLDNINKLSAAIQGNDTAATEEVFAFLGAYSVEHFSTEEEYMRRYDYPFLQEHIQEHEAFIRGFTTAKRKILSHPEDKLLALFHINLFLYDWLISHSTRIDKHFANHVLKALAQTTG